MFYNNVDSEFSYSYNDLFSEDIGLTVWPLFKPILRTQTQVMKLSKMTKKYCKPFFIVYIRFYYHLSSPDVLFKDVKHDDL